MDNLRIYISTWNVATNSPNIDLNPLLDFPSIVNKHRPLPDFYVLGFQEVNSQPQNYLIDSVFNDPWTANITDILKKDNYVRIKQVRLQGLLLMIFCLRVHLVHLRDVETQYTKTGLGGLWGNKGAVSIRLTIYGCSITFVNAHLTPHDNQLKERVNDYNTIIKDHTYNVKDTSNILYHDYVFWLGDLNFRLMEPAGKMPEDIVERVRRSEKDNYTELLQHDQLKSVMLEGLAFSELKEGIPGFPPTYKYIIGTSEYDLKRRPSWTDRILYRVTPNNYDNVTLCATQLRYQSLPQYMLSDHKPVVSEFNIKIRTKRSSLVSPPRRFMTYSGGTETDGGSPSDNEDEIFSNHTERIVEFLPIKDIWYIGDADLIIKFTLTRDIEVNSGDWIGVYESDFENLDEYITYEYVGKANTVVPTGEDSSRMIVFSFPVGSGVRSPGTYKFLYFSQPSSDVRSLLGMSEQFEVRVRGEENADLSNNSDLPTPSTSSSQSSQPSSSTEPQGGMFNTLIHDFRNMHVPGVRFDRLNDLSID